MRIAVVGAGGHSKEAADLIVACGHEVAGFVDERVEGPHGTTGLPVVRSLSELGHDAVVLAIGDVGARARWFDELGPDVVTPTLVHPSAIVSSHAVLGRAVQVMQNVVVNAAAVVGDDCILNVACSVAHDCTVGAHCHLGPGCRLGGGSSLGERCLVGTNATVMPLVSVGCRSVVGAGAVVHRPVADGLTVVGVPAREVADGAIS